MLTFSFIVAGKILRFILKPLNFLPFSLFGDTFQIIIVAFQPLAPDIPLGNET